MRARPVRRRQRQTTGGRVTGGWARRSLVGTVVAVAGAICLAAPAAAVTASKPAVIRQAQWYLRTSLTSGPADLSFIYGRPTDTPVTGDWDGNGTRTPGVVRDGIWYLRNAPGSGPADVPAFSFGRKTDQPIAGDWDGDGRQTPGVVRTNKVCEAGVCTVKGSTFFLRNSNTEGISNIVIGFPRAGRGIAGDWTGDGITNIGIFDHGMWYLRNTNTSGRAELSFRYGLSGDTPVVGDWNADRLETAGVVRGNAWYLRNENVPGSADVPPFTYGVSGDWRRGWR